MVRASGLRNAMASLERVHAGENTGLALDSTPKRTSMHSQHASDTLSRAEGFATVCAMEGGVYLLDGSAVNNRRCCAKVRGPLELDWTSRRARFWEASSDG